jgi:hypothetical protein
MIAASSRLLPTIFMTRVSKRHGCRDARPDQVIEGTQRSACSKQTEEDQAPLRDTQQERCVDTVSAASVPSLSSV